MQTGAKQTDNVHLELIDVARRHLHNNGWLLRGITLTVSSGDRLAVVGPSGSGKTLLLRAMALLDPIDAGRVLWNGRAVRGKGVPGFRRRVMYVPQQPVLTGQTVLEALQQPFHLAVYRRLQFDLDRVVLLLEQLGRDRSFLQKTVGELSGGESQIVAFLRSLQLNPDILLLDEPTAALDSQTASLVERLLMDWMAQDARRAIVLVTHQQQQAQRLATRVFRMENGLLVPVER